MILARHFWLSQSRNKRVKVSKNLLGHWQQIEMGNQERKLTSWLMSFTFFPNGLRFTFFFGTDYFVRHFFRFRCMTIGCYPQISTDCLWSVMLSPIFNVSLISIITFSPTHCRTCKSTIFIFCFSAGPEKRKIFYYSSLGKLLFRDF